MFMKKVWLLVLLPLLCVQCDYIYFFEVRNNSDLPVVFVFTEGWEDSLKNCQTLEQYRVEPDSNLMFMSTISSFLDDLLEKRVHRFSFIFFHADTLQKYSWSEIQEKNLYLQRYDLRPYDLQDFDFISFPPDPAMRYMRMTPSYGTYESLLKDSINQTNR